jgi:hypothetical protein
MGAAPGTEGEGFSLIRTSPKLPSPYCRWKYKPPRAALHRTEAAKTSPSRNDLNCFHPTNDTHPNRHKALFHSEREILIFLYFKKTPEADALQDDRRSCADSISVLQGQEDNLSYPCNCRCHRLTLGQRATQVVVTIKYRLQRQYCIPVITGKRVVGHGDDLTGRQRIAD